MLKLGDVVRLNSGGPDMTVTKINGNRAETSWHSSANTIENGDFPIVGLILLMPCSNPVAEAARAGFDTIHTDSKEKN